MHKKILGVSLFLTLIFINGYSQDANDKKASQNEAERKKMEAKADVISLPRSINPPQQDNAREHQQTISQQRNSMRRHMRLRRNFHRRHRLLR